ncbi:MAG TPA: pimeloyl-CoA dehydrogenase small subunit, partial [Haliea salexigens]|nr:pimeloyl-CoA dehydrogenase small subunit [Haliea salexigens]
LQHRMVDTFMAYEQVKSLLYRAVCELDGAGDDAAACVHALQVLVDRNGRKIFGEAIQLHGGMGITDELDIGHYAKRLMMINTTFGNGDYHQAKFNELRYSA